MGGLLCLFIIGSNLHQRPFMTQGHTVQNNSNNNFI